MKYFFHAQKIAVVALSTLLITNGCSASQEAKRRTGSDWTTMRPSGGVGCADITGSYHFWGENAPHFPSRFKGMLPLSLDIVTGIDIPYSDRAKVTSVYIEQGRAELVFNFNLPDAVVYRAVYPSKNVTFTCGDDVLTITRKDFDIKGEGQAGKVDVVYRLYLNSDGALIVHSSYSGYYNALLFFRKGYKEEYLIKFRKHEL